MCLVVDHHDLEKIINCLLEFCIDECSRYESISVELDSEAQQNHISVCWCIPKLYTDWDEKKCVEYSKDRIRDMRSYFTDEFEVEQYRTIIVGDNIWLYCNIFTVANQESAATESD